MECIQKWTACKRPPRFTMLSTWVKQTTPSASSKISQCWCCIFLCPASQLCPVLCVCVGLGWESCITVVMSRLPVRLIPQQHPALTRPLNKAFDPAAAAEKVTACLWLPCQSVSILNLDSSFPFLHLLFSHPLTHDWFQHPFIPSVHPPIRDHPKNEALTGIIPIHRPSACQPELKKYICRVFVSTERAERVKEVTVSGLRFWSHPLSTAHVTLLSIRQLCQKTA